MNNRRKLLVVLGAGALTAPLSSFAQQPAMPAVGYLSGRSSGDSAHIVAAFRQGLKESGFIEGQNVVIEMRFAEGRFDRLPVPQTLLVQAEEVIE
jgi:putative ABC transport system substrate-binding protein